MTKEKDYDVIIMGGGPAGLTAGIYASREKLSTLIMDKAVAGGLPLTTEFIENYPGFPGVVTGNDLMARFKEQAGKCGAEIREFEETTKIERREKSVIVSTRKGEYQAPTAVIATGSVPKKLNVAGEEELSGKGVSYCAICDGPLYRGKDVAIIGCGNSGLQEGESLLRFVKSVTFIEYLPQMTAAKVLQDRLRKNEKTRFFLNHQVTGIKGDKSVSCVKAKDRATGEEKEISVQGVFIYAGFQPMTSFVKGIIELNEKDFIVTGERLETSVPGIFAAGDVRAKRIRQIDTACGDGTIAALSCAEYINEIKE